MIALDEADGGEAGAADALGELVATDDLCELCEQGDAGVPRDDALARKIDDLALWSAFPEQPG